MSKHPGPWRAGRTFSCRFSAVISTSGASKARSLARAAGRVGSGQGCVGANHAEIWLVVERQSDLLTSTKSVQARTLHRPGDVQVVSWASMRKARPNLGKTSCTVAMTRARCFWAADMMLSDYRKKVDDSGGLGAVTVPWHLVSCAQKAGRHWKRLGTLTDFALRHRFSTALSPDSVDNPISDPHCLQMSASCVCWCTVIASTKALVRVLPHHCHSPLDASPERE